MSIERYAYSDTSIFASEMARLFQSRIFAGIAAEYTALDSYKSFVVREHAITVRRTANGVRAFNNVCLHRNALIDPLGEGTRAFRCGYHGWCYDEDGQLKSTPMTAIEHVVERQLTEYPVALAEGMCFVATSSLPDVVGIREALDEAEIVLDKPFHYESLEHAANWKLLVENVIESQHLSHVHAKTFVQAGFTSSAEYETGRHGTASWGRLTPSKSHDRTRAIERISARARHFFGHVYLFPDVFISNTNGLVGYLGNVLPIGPARSLLNWSLFELPALLSLPESVRSQVRADAIAFSRTALQEDRVIVEACQLGLTATGNEFQLQPNESRILDFHSYYKERMLHDCK